MSLRQRTRREASDVVERRRPREGWTRDFSTDVVQDRDLVVRAETAVFNTASQTVLRHVGFVEVGLTSTFRDGELIT